MKPFDTFKIKKATFASTFKIEVSPAYPVYSEMEEEQRKFIEAAIQEKLERDRK